MYDIMWGLAAAYLSIPTYAEYSCTWRTRNTVIWKSCGTNSCWIFTVTWNAENEALSCTNLNIHVCDVQGTQPCDTVSDMVYTSDFMGTPDTCTECYCLYPKSLPRSFKKWKTIQPLCEQCEQTVRGQILPATHSRYFKIEFSFEGKIYSLNNE